MLEYLEKKNTVFAISTSLLLVISFLVWPKLFGFISMVLFSLGIIMATASTYRKHQASYQQAECTREKMIRNLTLDSLGFLFTMGAAIYMGGLAGGYIGLRAGIWLGLLAGFAGGFLAAWVVRSAWGKLVLARI